MSRVIRTPAAALRHKLLVSISISGRWPRRFVSAVLATTSGWAVLQLTGYKTVGVLVGAGSGVAVVLRHDLVREEVARWKDEAAGPARRASGPGARRGGLVRR